MGIGPFNAIGIYYWMVIGGWSIECVDGGWFLFEKQAQKHCKVLLNLVHIIYYLSRTLLGKCLLLVYNRVVQVIELLGGQ